MSTELAVVERSAPLTVNDMVKQAGLIQDVMRALMKEGEHYGRIPGCGDKPTLLKPGAEKICLTFKLRAEFFETVIELPDGHREVRMKCVLSNRDGEKIAEGIGVCSTMESKYRWRRGEPIPTGRPCPKNYWDQKKADPRKAQELIGGKGFFVTKVDGAWQICQGGERTENPDLADCYNTVAKIAKKRAYVDATLTATAASDFFTQDVEDFYGEQVEAPAREPAREASPPPQEQKPEPPRQEAPRQEPPRQAPPRQEPPRQEPPRQDPPRQDPPPQEPHQNPAYERLRGFLNQTLDDHPSVWTGADLRKFCLKIANRQEWSAIEQCTDKGADKLIYAVDAATKRLTQFWTWTREQFGNNADVLGSGEKAWVEFETVCRGALGDSPALIDEAFVTGAQAKVLAYITGKMSR